MHMKFFLLQLMNIKIFQKVDLELYIIPPVDALHGQCVYEYM